LCVIHRLRASYDPHRHLHSSPTRRSSDLNLSEIEKAQKAAADAQAELDRISKENLRNSVALAKGVPADLVQFLNGDTEDDLNAQDRKSTRLNSSHVKISYAVFCLKKKKNV